MAALSDRRTAKINKNIVGLFGLKGLNILIGFIQVPLVLNYLDVTQFGIWITLTVILGWFSLFNVGIGNGLRNRLTEAVANNDLSKARIYVSTTYAAVALIFTIVLLLFLIANFFLDWTLILNTPPGLANELQLLAAIVFIFFCARFVVSLIETICLASQEPARAQLINFAGRATALIGILLLVQFVPSRLLYLGLVLAGVPVLVSAGFSFYYFTNRYRKFKPSFSLIRFGELKYLMNLGVKFFFIQVSTIVFYQTNSIIISQMFSPAEVTPYSIAYKLFGLITIGFMIMISPYWSAITDAYTRGEMVWIKTAMRRLRMYWMLFMLVNILLLLFHGLVIRLWIGDDVVVPPGLAYVIALYIVLHSFNSIYSAFINGTGKLNLQMYRTAIMALLYIPLTIFFVNEFGLQGIMFTLIIFEAVALAFYHLQYRKIITHTAEGIWNR